MGRNKQTQKEETCKEMCEPDPQLLAGLKAGCAGAATSQQECDSVQRDPHVKTPWVIHTHLYRQHEDKVGPLGALVMKWWRGKDCCCSSHKSLQ